MPQDYSSQQPGDEPDRPHLNLLQQVEPDLDHDEDDDDPLEPVRVADLELVAEALEQVVDDVQLCLLYTSPSPRDQRGSRMPSSA